MTASGRRRERSPTGTPGRPPATSCELSRPRRTPRTPVSATSPSPTTPTCPVTSSQPARWTPWPRCGRTPASPVCGSRAGRSPRCSTPPARVASTSPPSASRCSWSPTTCRTSSTRCSPSSTAPGHGARSSSTPSGGAARSARSELLDILPLAYPADRRGAVAESWMNLELGDLPGSDPARDLAADLHTRLSGVLTDVREVVEDSRPDAGHVLRSLADQARGRRGPRRRRRRHRGRRGPSLSCAGSPRGT